MTVKNLRGTFSLEKTPHGYQFRVPRSSQEEWTLGLVLLTMGFVEALSAPQAGLHRLGMNSDLERSERGAVRNPSNGGVVVEFTPTEIEAWTHFFLRAFRDGNPEVDHLDCEVSEAERRVDFTVSVDERPFQNTVVAGGPFPSSSGRPEVALK